MAPIPAGPALAALPTPPSTTRVAGMPSAVAIAPDILIHDAMAEARSILRSRLGAHGRTALRMTHSLFRQEDEASRRAVTVSDSDHIAVALARFPNLETLRFKTMLLLAIDRTNYPSNDHRRLRELNLKCGNRTRSPFDLAFLKHLPGLERLRMDIGELRNADWLSHAKALPNLRELSSNSMADLPDNGIPILATMPWLRRLDITCQDLGDADVAMLATLANLDTLVLRGESQFGNKAMQTVAAMPNLRVLGMKVCHRVDQDGLAALAAAKDLHTLSIAGSRETGATGLAELAGLPNLAHVTLANYRFDTATMRALAGLPALQHLTLEAGSTDSAAMIELGKCKNLLGLSIKNFAQAAPWDWSPIANCKALETIDVSGCRAFGNDCLASLVAEPRPALTRLSIAGNVRMTDDGILPLGELRNLRSLDASGTRIGPATIAACVANGKLETLNLTNCGLVNDAALARIAQLPELHTLTLYGNRQVTDAGLRHLSALRHLRELDLGACNELTRTGIAGLQQSLPELKIIQ